MGKYGNFFSRGGGGGGGDAATLEGHPSTDFAFVGDVNQFSRPQTARVNKEPAILLKNVDSSGALRNVSRRRRRRQPVASEKGNFGM